MFRTLCLVTALFFGLACNVPAATVVLSDSTLLSLTDVGGSGGTIDLVTDIAGDPGVQYDATFATTGGWSDITMRQFSPTEIGIGDTAVVTIKNLDPLYPTFASIFMQVDGWSWNEGGAVWIDPGATETLSMLNPAVGVINALGIKLGTDLWTGRADGSSASVQVIPEPSTIVLLAFGGLLLWCKRS